jgi:hypothetical protein
VNVSMHGGAATLAVDLRASAREGILLVTGGAAVTKAEAQTCPRGSLYDNR